ncbi:cell division protein FtsH [Candidatus Kaiserbacteria bacterium RIFCSPHIGHO2_01_FULL_50_13]|uniref:ATP-dependent zinc metalloprotease FtsH n=1 Tax=Candidatus Kaiserbacteria bacterium RIFCSPLOWO2_01_FULL_50_24 TaxID=1798507 RepID=A0A1F6EIH1_9BACT|nr:MAG: cell division protein FtsH [Candidatus Kaiserbacteria bacterium RIFCSPHIGHO2_01_FULL_50_13]OGG73460.1 MAG: cell division protein FtsH [Candidatus Kaiserbacteria bacterium RIFCSPLOWO2_01_FULL_50_24]
MQFAIALAIFLVLSSAYSLAHEYVFSENEEVPLSKLASDIASGLVVSISVEGSTVKATYADESVKTSKKELETSFTETLKNYDLTPEQMSAVEVTIGEEGGVRFWFFQLAPLLVPILLLVGIIWYLSRQVRGAGMQAFSFGRSMARLVSPEDEVQRVMFRDVAGAKEAKSELLEIVDFLKNPKKFIQIGARIPKGVLLMGASGTGKTLLARAVAGEAGVPFFSISGSEFVEMFVGVGASRTRDLFQTAKKSSPAIVFIDEIDAVGRVRGTGVGGGNDEREQTLNQILVEMDGFEPNEALIVLAATNRPDVLDPALVRPGRFDRRVVIDLPDRKDREEILTIHARKKPLGADVNLSVIAERTPGLSGADLANVMNEGAILAARENRKEITQYDLVRSIEKVMLGPERRSHVLNKKEKEITAYHEAGHALVASVLPYADPVHKISIISRGRAAGYTLKLPFEDRRMQSRREFLDDIAMSLGGYVAEKMVFGDITTGASNDLQVLSALARDMVTRYGMSEKLGPIALDAALGKTLFGQGIEGGNDRSDETAEQIDMEVKLLIGNAHKKATDIIKKHRKVLDAIAKKLIEVETIERDEFEKILIANGITPKRKEDIEHASLV